MSVNYCVCIALLHFFRAQFSLFIVAKLMCYGHSVCGFVLLELPKFYSKLVELPVPLDEMAFNTSSCNVDGGSDKRSVVVDK